MRFFLFINTSSDAARAASAQLEHLLRMQGQHISASAGEADMIIVLGGDGTVLRAVRQFQQLNKPFWAVNCGHLGYLTDCALPQAQAGLSRLMQGAYRLEQRSLLSGQLLDEPVLALNEMILHRGACAHALQIEARVNGQIALRYRGDGLLVCTATGSTAYNLSCGGPLLMPEMELVCLTPICAQALSALPVVVSAHDEVCIDWRMSAYDEINEQPCATVDGERKGGLPNQGRAVLKGPVRRAALVRTQDAAFYERVQARMKWNV